MIEEPPFRNLYALHTQFAAVIREQVKNFDFADNVMAMHWLFALACYLVPFGSMLFVGAGSFAFWLLSACTGLGAALMVFTMTQSGAHNEMFKHRWLGRLMLISGYLLGRPQFYWTTGHAKLHHQYTNVPEFDHEINAFGLLRLDKQAPHRPLQNFQKYYAWVLYGLSPLFYFLADFELILFYRKYKLLKRPALKLIDLLLSKLVYLSVFIALAMFLAHESLRFLLPALLMINFIAGIIVFSISAACHYFEGTELLRRYNGVLDAEPLCHQLFATRGFSHHNLLLTWLTAAANFHVEHHLFPDVPFVYYPQMAAAIEKNARSYGFTYHHLPSLGGLLRSHFHYLELLSHRPEQDHRYDEQFRGHYFKQKQTLS